MARLDEPLVSSITRQKAGIDRARLSVGRTF
jgi:hypothetical protein